MRPNLEGTFAVSDVNTKVHQGERFQLSHSVQTGCPTDLNKELPLSSVEKRLPRNVWPLPHGWLSLLSQKMKPKMVD